MRPSRKLLAIATTVGLPAGTSFRVKEPSARVVTVDWVPRTETVAPSRGWPFMPLTTVPLTVPFEPLGGISIRRTTTGSSPSTPRLPWEAVTPSCSTEAV
ncbi:hypothetical protein D3C72_732100 [compost metagenome]